MNKHLLLPFAKKHAPEILTGVGVAGIVATIALTVTATMKSIRILDNEREKRLHNNLGDENENIEGLVKLNHPERSSIDGWHHLYRLPAKDMIRLIWRPCLPAVITGTASIVCLVGSNAIHLRRDAAFTAAYAISEAAFRDYRGKVVELVGAKKEDEIHTALVQDKIDRNPVTKTEVIIASDGTVLCYDAFTGRYFMSDRNTIESAVNNINRIMLDDGWATLNELYDCLDLENTELGESLGWDAAHGNLIVPRFSSHLASDGRPCLAFSFNDPPQYRSY